MKTIESALSLLTDRSIVEDLRRLLREKDQEFALVEEEFKKAIALLNARIDPQTIAALLSALDQQVCSDLVYAGYLGFQANLVNYHNPTDNQFTRLDSNAFLKQHIMHAMPYRRKAEIAAAAIQETYKELLDVHKDAFRNYYVYLEVTGPKLAHFWGYCFANQFLPWVEAGYVSDSTQTCIYTLELQRYLGFPVCSR